MADYQDPKVTSTSGGSKTRPILIGIGVIVVILLLLWLFGIFGGGGDTAPAVPEAEAPVIEGEAAPVEN